MNNKQSIYVVKKSYNNNLGILSDFADWLAEQLNDFHISDLPDNRTGISAVESCITHDWDATHSSVDEKTFHCYAITSHSIWKGWRQSYPIAYANRKWFCSSISDAAKRYSFTRSTKYFQSLADSLQTAIRKQNRRDTRQQCLEILRWGGTPVSNKMTVWLDQRTTAGKLIQSINKAIQRLAPTSTTSLNAFGHQAGLIMNAGMAKNYAAAAMDVNSESNHVLLYDGRVGAALGLLSRRYCISRRIPIVPNVLRFGWGIGRGGKPGGLTPRDPSLGPYIFPPLRSGVPHATYARNAAWVMQRALNTSGPSPAFTHLERALFMIGYDVRHHCDGTLRLA